MKKMYGFSLLTISLVALVVVAFMDIPVHRQYVAAFVPIIGIIAACVLLNMALEDEDRLIVLFNGECIVRIEGQRAMHGQTVLVDFEELDINIVGLSDEQLRSELESHLMYDHRDYNKGR